MSNNVHIDNNFDNLKISEASKIMGVSTKTLRRWEKKGLIKSDRSVTGQRVYHLEDLQRPETNNLPTPIKSGPKKDNLIKLCLAVLILSISIISQLSLRGAVGDKAISEDRLLHSVRNDTESKVLAATIETIETIKTEVSDFVFSVAVPAIFKEKVTFKKNITAPNVVYSVNGETGTVVLELTAGSGITVSGTTVTNADTGSSQKIFKTIKIGSSTFEAGSNTDTLELVASGGITLSSDTSNKKVTIASSLPDYTLSGFTDGGTVVYLSTLTDSVGIGTITPTHKLDVVGTGSFSDTLTLDGALVANGSITLGDTSSDSITFTARIADGTSLVPLTDLGASLGSSDHRFNNLWVANINSNSSQAFSGQTTFSYAPTTTAIDEASVLINPASSVANGQLLGFGINGYQRALFDAEGDLILGYNNLTSAPTTDYPLSIYGHNSTQVAYLDASGNLNITGGYSIAGTSVLTGTTLGAGVVNSSLTGTGALNSGSITSGFGSIDTGADNIITTGTIGSAGLTTFTGDSLTLDNTLSTPQITSTANLALMPTGNVGIGTLTPAQKLTVLGDLASSVATGVEGLKLTDTTDVTKMALKWTGTGVTLDTKGAGAILTVANSTTGLGGLSVESTSTLNSGLASLQALIVKGFSGQTEDLQEWQDSTSSVLASISATGVLTSAGGLDINGTSNDIAGALNLSGNALTSSGALSITPASGNNLNIALSGTGDFKVNTNDLVVDTSASMVGIGNTAPSAKLHIISTTEQLRLGYDTSNYWSNTVGVSGGLTMQGVGTGGSLTLSPTSGQNLNISLATIGDMVVNTNDLVVDTSLGYIGINTTAPTALLDLAGTSGTDAFRLTNSGSKVLGLKYETNAVTFDQTSTDPTNKLVNSTFDSDLTSWSEVPSYTLNDQFTTDRAAGAVNGTSAEPTGGTRTVVDTNGKLSITGGLLSFAAGSAWGNPGLDYSVLTRGSGKTLVGVMNINTYENGPALGFLRTLSPLSSDTLLYNSGALRIYDNPTDVIVGNALSTGTTYQLALVLRSTGSYYFIKGGAYTNWTLLYSTAVNNTASLYPGIVNSTSVFTSDNIRIPTATWLPTPLAYDTFTRGDGAIGNSETTGPDSQTTPSLAWTGGAISSNKNVITPTLGSELLTNTEFATDTSSWTALSGATLTRRDFTSSPDIDPTGGSDNFGLEVQSGGSDSSRASQAYTMTVNEWWLFTARAYSPSANTATNVSALYTPDAYFGNNKTVGISSENSWTTLAMSGRNTATSQKNFAFRTLSTTAGDVGYYDAASVKLLTLSSLFSTVSTSDADVIADANVTLTAGTQAGLVLNLDSTSSPANFIIVYHDGTSVKVDEAVAGVYTNKQTTTVTYSAGATLRAIREGTKLRVYYNNALVGAELTMTANTNTKHGLFSTYSGNSFDNFTLWPRGSGTTKFTDAPFEELTATRDTGTKYAGSASAKLVASGVDANYLQSVNVGDTATYNLIAYAYTTGAAVTSADLSLYYDTAAITTTYTAMGGSGWYKLTGSFTGVASAKDYGVRVKAGKTVYVDEMHLQVGTGTAQTMYVMNSNTGVTGLNVQGLINGTLNGIATFSKAGTISDADFTTATDGLMGIDTTNHRIYFREGGAWSYAAKTGGFQVPAEEAGGLNIGDLLLPYVESRMSDGALHGLYKKFSDTPLSGLTVTGGTTLGDAIITGSLLVSNINNINTLSLQSLALNGIDFVGGNIKFSKDGLIYGNDLIRGKEIIATGETQIRVNKTWEESPTIINTSPEFETKTWVTDISENGFTINTSSPAISESIIYWQAIW